MNVSKERQKLKSIYRSLYSDVESIFFKHDPMGINFIDNTDEYDPEVDTILPRLKDTKSSSDVSRIVREEFSKWFDQKDAEKIAQSKYDAIASEIWKAWIKFTRPLA